MTGPVAITRAGAVVDHPSVGDPVYQADEIETGADGLASIAFSDGTIFHLHAGTRLVLDEFTCGPDKLRVQRCSESSKARSASLPER